MIVRRTRDGLHFYRAMSLSKLGSNGIYATECKSDLRIWWIRWETGLFQQVFLGRVFDYEIEWRSLQRGNNTQILQVGRKSDWFDWHKKERILEELYEVATKCKLNWTGKSSAMRDSRTVINKSMVSFRLLWHHSPRSSLSWNYIWWNTDVFY